MSEGLVMKFVVKRNNFFLLLHLKNEFNLFEHGYIEGENDEI